MWYSPSTRTRVPSFGQTSDAAHIADGVIGLKQRSLAANDPTE